MFAYNITTVSGGKIVTSPVISEDGTKIAFVESVAATAAIFHVLTFTAHQGTITAAATPGTAMTSLTFSPTKDDTTSSPWVDYSADVAYVGADDGRLYKITGVFKGTPALAPGWPVLLALNNRLSPPVLDSSRSLLMVGSGNGSLYQVDTTNPSSFFPLAIGKAGAKTSGILTAPVVDVTNGTTFAASANDGISSAVLVQADTRSLTVLTRVTLGVGSSGGVALYIQEPAFDNQYFDGPSGGNIFVCGTGTLASDTSPWEYSFGFTGRNMNSTTSFSQQLLPSTAAQCTGWTEFFNPNIPVGTGTDFFFVGLTQDCAGTGTPGCVVERVNNTTVATAPLSGGPSGIIVDNYSLDGQASSIYMTAEKANIAYKLTQNLLK
jgi:hypothetical protein